MGNYWDTLWKTIGNIWETLGEYGNIYENHMENIYGTCMRNYGKIIFRIWDSPRFHYPESGRLG